MHAKNSLPYDPQSLLQDPDLERVQPGRSVGLLLGQDGHLDPGRPHRGVQHGRGRGPGRTRQGHIFCVIGLEVESQAGDYLAG